MKARVLIGLFLLILSAFSYPQNALAHVLKTDGSVGAVIHVSPEDDPIAGESTDFYFEFKDKTGKFTPENCDCNGSILQGGKEVYSAPLFQNSTNPSLENASFSYTFPEKNIYKVRVSGKPITTGVFESFTLEWDIRVARVSKTQVVNDAVSNSDVNRNGLIDWTSRHIPHLIGAVLIAGFFIFALVKQHVKKRESKETL